MKGFFFITNGQFVCKMALAQMCLSAEQMSFLQQNVHVKCGKTNFILTEEFEVKRQVMQQ